MFFHWLVDRHSGTDIGQVVVILHEPIDPTRLEAAWQAALDTCAVLRTVVAWERVPVPVQRAEPHASISFTSEDVREIDALGRERHIEEFLRADRRRGFDLAEAPAMRVALFRTEDTRYTMVWSFHRILLDDRSAEIILGRVFSAYVGEELETDDRTYRDYVDWIESQDAASAADVWRSKLAGFTAPTPLPGDLPPSTRASGYEEVRIQVAGRTTLDLRQLATRAGASLNELLMSAWALLLSRYSGESDVTFGATMTTRLGSIPDVDSRVGLFLATLPVRVQVDGELTVHDWLRRVHEEWVSIRGSEHLSLVKIRNVSDVPASEPLFHSLVMFEDQQLGGRLGDRADAWASRCVTIREQTGLPLTLFAYGGEELLLTLQFDTSQFSRGTAARMLGHMATVLEAWSRDAEAPIWSTPIFTGEERMGILEAWQGPQRDYPWATPLAALVEAQVDRTPDAPAVTFGSETLTYRELNSRANRLAHALCRNGAGPDVLVGVAVDRSLGMIVALLAVMKAGAAYVPLDPTLPRNRLAYMIEDSGLGVLITQSVVLAALPPFAGALFNLDAPTWLDGDGTNPDVEVGPEQLGMVIYTSGSTGRPKGVEVFRRGLINVLWALRDLIELGSDDRVLSVTTMSFDIFGVDLWLSLLVGAQVVVMAPEGTADGEQLRDAIERHDITFLQATPVTWRGLLVVGWSGKRGLRALCGGEAMPLDFITGLAPLVDHLWNVYGPTETTIWSTEAEIRPDSERVTIGRPLANTRCYILDGHERPVPVGVVGELFIAGDGVARGYWNRPILTSEKFVPDPFHQGPEARMYRTGDLARYLPDGAMECLGRTDHQVKVRGFRIELDEIGSVLLEHPAVRQATVIAREDTPGDKRLVAYIVAKDATPEVSALRRHLKEALPAYMVPTAFVSLDELPISPNGKVDRRALPAPETGDVVASHAVIAPRTHAEKQLSQIWKGIFELDEVGVTDDFFELGGHSILAVELMAAIDRVFGKRLPLNTIFEAATIELLAERVEEPDHILGQHTLVSIQAAGTRPPAFWIPGGAALGLFRLQHIVNSFGPEQPVFGLGSQPPESLDAIETVEERAARYLELIQRAHPTGPYTFIGFCAGGLVAFEMAHQVRRGGGEVSFLGLINSSFPGYPSSALARWTIRAQHLIHQIGTAREDGTGVLGLVRQKREGRRKARAARGRRETLEREVQRSGFQEDDTDHADLLLEATDCVMERYRPAHYPGAITHFMSDDPAFAGVSRRLDSRFEWARVVDRFTVEWFKGGHIAVVDAPEGAEFAETLTNAIDAALVEEGVPIAEG